MCMRASSQLVLKDRYWTFVASETHEPDPCVGTVESRGGTNGDSVADPVESIVHFLRPCSHPITSDRSLEWDADPCLAVDVCPDAPDGADPEILHGGCHHRSGRAAARFFLVGDDEGGVESHLSVITCPQIMVVSRIIIHEATLPADVQHPSG